MFIVQSTKRVGYFDIIFYGIETEANVYTIIIIIILRCFIEITSNVIIFMGQKRANYARKNNVITVYFFFIIIFSM